jgi:hypothetical protein
MTKKDCDKLARKIDRIKHKDIPAVKKAMRKVYKMVEKLEWKILDMLI